MLGAGATHAGNFAPMPTSLVTGGAGFLGSHLCDRLIERGHRVICVDNVETGSLRNIDHIRDEARFRFMMVDITSHFEVDEPLDFVYHMASPASPIDYARLPLHTLKVGAYGTHNALGLAKAKRARFLLASTSEVYGDPLVHPQPETYWGNVNPIGPRGVYDEAKRYAEALTMAYRRQQGVDTAIVRIFNSILADEQVLYDDGTELRREPVSQLAERLSAYSPAAAYAPHGRGSDAAPIEATEYPLEGYSVPAFGPGGDLAASPASALLEHGTSARCYEVSTRYGRSIRVTGDHSIFVEGPAGEPEARPVDELEAGERVAVARRLRVPERDRREASMLEVWRHCEGDPWDLLVEHPELGPLAWEHRHDLLGLLASERRHAKSSRRSDAWTKIVQMRHTGRVPLPALRRFGAAVPEGARVRLRSSGRDVALPATIPLTDELLWLLGLWVAKGSWHEGARAAYLTIGGDASLLARATAVIEGELGLRVVSAPGARPARLSVHSKLLLRLLERLGFDAGRKRVPGWILGLPLRRLKWFVEGFREGDGVHVADEARHEFQTVHEELKDDLVVALARFGLLASVSRTCSLWRLTLCRVSPWSPLAWDGGVEQSLEARVSGDLVWAPITSIAEIPPTDRVYDFSVPGRENFWAGSGVMAHNTYGPRMRPNDGRAIPTFLSQALAHRPLTVFGDGSQTRSFVYVDDEVRGLIALAESGVHEPVNIGNPNEMSLIEMARLVIELTGARSEVVFESLPVDDPQVRQPDIARARALLGWEPEIELREGLRRTIEHAVAGLEQRA